MLKFVFSESLVDMMKILSPNGDYRGNARITSGLLEAVHPSFRRIKVILEEFDDVLSNRRLGTVITTRDSKKLEKILKGVRKPNPL